MHVGRWLEHLRCMLRSKGNIFCSHKSQSFFLGSVVYALLLPAIVFLCLLEAAFVQASDYSWTGPGKNKENEGVDPNTENGERFLRKYVKS